MRKSFVALVLLLATTAAAAAEAAPHEVVRAVTDRVLAIVLTSNEGQPASAREIMQGVEAAVRPHFNFTRMTEVAMERHWRQATPHQQKALTEEFRTLLLRIYAIGIALYGNHKVDYRTVRLPGIATEVVVRSVITQPSGQPVTIDYSMEKLTGTWRAYDVKIDGVSLVENYRNTFNSEIQKNGIDGLIEALSQKNQVMANSAR